MNGIDKLGHTAAEIMEKIEGDELPDGAAVAEVMVIAAVKWPIEGEGAGNCTYYRCSSAFPWVQKGLLDLAAEAVDSARRPWEPE